MKKLYEFIHNKNWSLGKKRAAFLTITTLSMAALGEALWFILHFFALNKISWAIIFLGYPGFIIGLLGGIFYLFRHDL